ncbi:bifunctional glutamate N-acetyltransferase/amino-acid acetyltransferase ArgJ [Alkaliphilus crotonatoxidans]
MEQFEIIEGNVTSPKGFLASGVHIGMKRVKKDLALVYSQVPAVGAGVFTTNKACAAPVIVSKENIKDNQIQAIIINSGNANACTGQQGLADAREMGAITAAALKIPEENIIVSSTGVIGVPLPMNLLKKGIPQAVAALSAEGGGSGAEAIMTTDTAPKTIGVVVEIDGKRVTVGGMAKGSGMIHPNMATMLAIVTTDILIEADYLNDLLKEATDQTYHMISVDGDTSTNDMVAVMANGLAGNEIMNHQHPQRKEFEQAFLYVHEYLAKAIVRDGEGATKFIEVAVDHAPNVSDARKAVKAVLTSNLVKTAFFGEDGNWGRILCSIGYSDANFDINKIEISLSSGPDLVKIVEGGQGTNYQEESVAALLKHQDIKIHVDMNNGNERAVGWGCDLSYDYVKINGAYRT